MTDPVASSAPAPGSAQRTVRHLIVYTLLAALVTITAVGLAGLLERVVGGAVLAGSDTAGLALWLAFTFIGGPLAAVLWWWVWRRLQDASERSSLAWGVYLTVMYTVSLVVASSALLSVAGALLVGPWLSAEFATAVTWTLVWVWHRWMLRHPRRGPVRLASVPTVIASMYGLVVGLTGAVEALGALLDAAIRGLEQSTSIGAPWWRLPVEGSFSFILGAAIWSWHWFHDRARELTTALADVALVLLGVALTAVVMLGGIGTALFVGSRLLFDPSDPVAVILSPLGAAIAAAVVGAIAWGYHVHVARVRSERTRRAQRLVMSAIGLAAAATGIGVVLNTLLAALAGPLAASGTRALLLAGLSALVVGGPTWWANWRPTRRIEPAEVADADRRIYLVVVFGASAIVALIALLIVSFRVFEFVLGPAAGGSLIDRVRAPLGLLVATALVFAYHFVVWRRDRQVIATSGPVTTRRIGRVILVVAGDQKELERLVGEATGAPVTVWRRAAPAPTPDAEAVVAALAGVTARRVLVIPGEGDHVGVVPLAE